MKKSYEMPEVSATWFNEAEDIITLSGKEDGDGKSEDLTEMYPDFNE